MPFAVMSSDGHGHIAYGFEFRECPSKTSCFYPESSALPMPHEDEVISLLLGIAIGQRKNTPATQNKFIGRHNKTFFSGRAHIAYTLKQDHLMNLSAIANYIHMSTRDPECGAVERIYDEYCFIVGNLAYTLVMTVKRLGAADANADDANDATGISKGDKIPAKHYVADPSKIRVPMMSVDEDTLAALTKCVSTPEEAVKLVSGAMICCCVRDHSTIEKDRKSVKLRRALSCFSEPVSAISERMGRCKASELKCDEVMCEALAQVAECAGDVIYIVRDGTDDVVNWLDPAYDETRVLAWGVRHARSELTDAAREYVGSSIARPIRKSKGNASLEHRAKGQKAPALGKRG